MAQDLVAIERKLVSQQSKSTYSVLSKNALTFRFFVCNVNFIFSCQDFHTVLNSRFSSEF